GATAPQIAAMLRFLCGFGDDWGKFELGAGVSHGKYTWNDLCYEDLCAQKVGTVTWANVEIGRERRWASGFTMRYFFGYGHVIAGDLVCQGAPSPPCMAADGYDTTYAGIAFGGAF